MIRIQLDMSEDRVRELDALAAETGAATRKELFNNALTLLEWAVRERRRGRAIASVDEDAKKIKELLMPALEAVRPDTVAAGKKR